MNLLIDIQNKSILQFMKAKHKLTSNDGFHENVVKLKYMELNIKKKYSRIIIYSLFSSKKGYDSTKICNLYSKVFLITLNHKKSFEPIIF